MAIFIGFLTVVLVLNCIFLVLLVLIQLPKKEAGIGVAFGGGATETLFGAGSGTVLTKATKYSAGLFMGLSLLLAILGSHSARRDRGTLDSELQKRASRPPATIPAVATNAAVAPAPTPTPATPPVTTSATAPLLLTSTNAPAPPTDSPPAPQ